MPLSSRAEVIIATQAHGMMAVIPPAAGRTPAAKAASAFR